MTLETNHDRGKKSQYRIRLEEKQKLRFHYGLTKRQLLKYVRIAGKAKGSTGRISKIAFANSIRISKSNFSLHNMDSKHS